MSNIVERIAQYAENKGLSIRQLEIAVGAGNGTISKAIKDKKDIQAKWIEKILYTYDDIDAVWLATGKGEMLTQKGNLNLKPDILHTSDTYSEDKKQKSGNKKGNLIGNPIGKNLTMPSVITIDTSGDENIFFVPFKAAAGYLRGYADPEFMETLPAYRLPGLNNGSYRMFEIKGPSMKPTLKDGDKVIGQWIDPYDIRDERVYVVVSKEEGIVVKRCINRLTAHGLLILKSDNRDFDDILLHTEDIYEAWEVKLNLTAKLPAPGESFYAISDLQARMTMLEDFVKKQVK